MMALNHCASSNGRSMIGVLDRYGGGLTSSSTFCANSHDEMSTPNVKNRFEGELPRSDVMGQQVKPG